MGAGDSPVFEATAICSVRMSMNAWYDPFNDTELTLRRFNGDGGLESLALKSCLLTRVGGEACERTLLLC